MTRMYFPVEGVTDLTLTLAPRKRSSEHGDSVVLFIDNGREGAAELLWEIGASLLNDQLIRSYLVWRKPSSSRPVTEDELAMLGRNADLVVAGVGSCGACTAGTVEDAIRFERFGIPSAVLITEAFDGTADAVADALGMPGYPHSSVEHPIGNRDAAWWNVAAHEVAPHLFRALTSEGEALELVGSGAGRADATAGSPPELRS
jgi:hypothetical protein